MQDDLTSIIIPTFNRSGLLKQALDSLLCQTYSNWEAVVVDDGSSDGTMEVLENYERRDPRIRAFIRGRLPKGACTCRNIGLAEARGDYVVFLDSDDLLAPTCLAQRMNVFRENGAAAFIVFQSLYFRERIDDSRLLLNAENEESDLARFLRCDPVWHTTGPIWKKSAVQKLGGFDEQLYCMQEVDLHLRALIQRLKYCKRLNMAPDVYVRCHRMGSISQDGFKSREAVASMFRVYEKSTRTIGASTDPETQTNLRQMLAFVVESALDNRHFDLAKAGMIAGKRDGLLGFAHMTIWKLAYWGYAAHARGFRGCARFGKRLLAPFQPKSVVGKFHYSGPLSLDPAGSCKETVA